MKKHTNQISSGVKKMKVVYVIETPKEVFWSKNKMDATYKHVQFLYRDKARWKEIPLSRWERYKNSTPKTLIEIQE